jgi:hypothetical protein
MILPGFIATLWELGKQDSEKLTFTTGSREDGDSAVRASLPSALRLPGVWVIHINLALKSNYSMDTFLFVRWQHLKSRPWCFTLQRLVLKGKEQIWKTWLVPYVTFLADLASASSLSRVRYGLIYWGCRIRNPKDLRKFWPCTTEQFSVVLLADNTTSLVYHGTDLTREQMLIAWG